jgi:hypothetical protein
LLRDRDQIFGQDFVDQVKAMGIKQVLSAPRSPWQRAYVERVIGTIRRECLDHVIVLGRASLSRHLQSFLDYYHHSRPPWVASSAGHRSAVSIIVTSDVPPNQRILLSPSHQRPALGLRPLPVRVSLSSLTTLETFETPSLAEGRRAIQPTFFWQI